MGNVELSAQITIGQYTGDFSTTVYGQSFTATDLGPNGSGVDPLPGDLLTLNSFTFAFGTSGGRDAVASLSIYGSQTTAANQSPALFTSTSFIDSVGDDLHFAYPSRTYVFTSNLTLTAGSRYYAGLSVGGNIAISSTNSYVAGEYYQLGVGTPGPTLAFPIPEFFTPADSPPVNYFSGSSDAVFYASLSNASIPEPGAYAAIAGVIALGLAAWRRQGRR